MFENIGGMEILIIVLIVVLLFGSKRIPDLAKGLGKGMKQFKKEIKDIKDIKDDIKIDDTKK